MNQIVKKVDNALPVAQNDGSDAKALMGLISRLATDSSIDPVRVEAAFAMYKEVKAMEAEAAFASAMAEFRSMSVVITKNSNVDYTFNGKRTAYNHASLDNAVAVIGDALSKVGLSFYWDTNQIEGGVISVTCVLKHRLGHFTKTTLSSLPDPSGGKNGIQAIGSTVAYLERYTLLAATGTATKEMDDDGAGSEDHPENTQPHEEPKSSLPPYPSERFEKAKANWVKGFKSGTSTPQQVIQMIGSKYSLSPEQKNAILNLKKESN